MNEEKTTEAKWSELDGLENAESKFFQPQQNKSYRMVFSSVELVRKAFKEGDEPKLTARCKIKTLNGEPSGKLWETRSLSVIKTLRPVVEGNRLSTSTFFLKKKMDNNRTSYVFESIGADVVVKGDDVASFM